MAANIPVLIVTGRSAGWVSGLVTYLPVVGAIAENGGLFYPADSAKAVALTPIPDLVEHRQQLEVAYQHLKSEFPQIEESTDNRFRVTDWTFDNRQPDSEPTVTLERFMLFTRLGFHLQFCAMPH
jgi:hydroxymethylpyrimidine pyrophosphatase-like HAD family hydrolase